MRRNRLVFCFLILWSLGGAAELFACGNKFLVVSRGTRFGLAPVSRADASILVYSNAISSMPQAGADAPIDQILVEAGYEPVTVTNPAELESALAERQWDVVLADLSDSSELSARFASADAPLVVPVLFEPTRAVMKQAKKNYVRVVRAPVKTHRLLDSVDEAVALRAR